MEHRLMAYKPKVATVSEGGTGDTSLTAYSVLCGGTTSTGAIQNVSGVGTSGQALTSNGAGALPTWQNISTGSVKFAPSYTALSINPADSTTYFFQRSSLSTVQGAKTRIYIPATGTITKCYLYFFCVIGSSEHSTFSIRLNDSSDTTVTSVIDLSTATTTYSNTGLSIAVSQGDFIEFKLVTPAWVTNPTQVTASVTAYIS